MLHSTDKFLAEQTASFIQVGVPEDTFEPKLQEGQSLEDYVKELNINSTEVGEEYRISNNKEGGNLIIKIIKPFFGFSLKNRDSKAENNVILMRKALENEGLSNEEIEAEIAYKLINGNLSSRFIKIIEKQIESMSEEDIQKNCDTLGITLSCNLNLYAYTHYYINF